MPVVLVDDCVGTVNQQGQCSLPPLVKIDGQPAQSMTSQQLQAFLNSRVTTLRLFVVNVTGDTSSPTTPVFPKTFSDVNGDGRIDAGDAAAAGWNLLSHEVVVKVKHFFEEPILGIATDLDGNGLAPGPPLPAGPGGLTEVPR